MQFESYIKRKDKVIVAALISVVVVSGILYSVSLGDKLRYSDERVYCTLASSILNNHQYSLDGENSTAYRPPGYPLILSFFMLLGADIVHYRILNFIALGLCIYLLYKILKEQSSSLAGVLGALLVVFYPVLFYTAGTLYPQTIGSFLFLLIIYFLTGNKKSYRTVVLSGLLFGCLILILPIFVLILFVVGAWFLFFERSTETKNVIITIVVAFLLPGVWCVRNCVVFRSFVFVSSNSGIMLLRGNSENTTPNAGPGVDISKYEVEATKLKLSGLERDAYFQSKAFEWIRNNKIKTLKLFCLKYLNYFNYRNNLATISEGSRWKDIIMLATYGPLLLLFICRVLLMRRLRPSSFEVLLVILYFSSAFFYAIFFTRIRYRLPFDFLMIAIVAMFVQRIFEGMTHKSGVK